MHLLNGGFDSISVPSVPFTMPQPLYVATKLLFWGEETGKKYSTEVDIVPPGNGSPIPRMPAEIEIVQAPDAEHPVSHLGLVTFFDLTFSVVGLYWVRQLVEGEVVKAIPLLIETLTESQTEKSYGYGGRERT